MSKFKKGKQGDPENAKSAKSYSNLAQEISGRQEFDGCPRSKDLIVNYWHSIGLSSEQETLEETPENKFQILKKAALA